MASDHCCNDEAFICVYILIFRQGNSSVEGLGFGDVSYQEYLTCFVCKNVSGRRIKSLPVARRSSKSKLHNNSTKSLRNFCNSLGKLSLFLEPSAVYEALCN